MQKVITTQDHPNLKVGPEYVVENREFAYLMNTQILKSYCPVRPRLTNHSKPGSVLVCRSGAIGDLVFLMPAIRELSKRGHKVTLATMSQNRDVYKHDPHVNNIIDYPITFDEFDAYDYHVVTEDLIELSGLGEQHHPVDLFLAAANIVHCDNKIPKIYMDSSDYTRTFQFPKVYKKRLGVQVMASGYIRTPPQWSAIIDKFVKTGEWEVFLFGAPKTVKTEIDGNKPITNLTRTKNPMSLRDSFAMIKKCDLFLGPDSGLLHVAGALGVPAVGLYGAFPSELRSNEYFPTVKGIDGKGPCAPCFWHARAASFPSNCPSKAQNQCRVLASITPDEVYSTSIAWMDEMKKES
jgi:ADP-heptose:LPS heptosyltransferase